MDFEGSRRGFLKTVGLALAGVLGAGFASGQEQKEKTAKDEKEKKKSDAKTESGTAGQKEPAARSEGEKGERETPPTKAEPAPKEEVTDEIRTCPQCGASMYRQGRVWTCDTCGYSYVE